MGKLEQVGAISAAKGGIDAKLLVADLDGTILRTDLLYESLVALACSRPWRLPGLIPHLLKGKAAFKRALVLQVSPDLDSLPCNEALLAWLRERRAEGHRIVLYSASDQLLVEGVARRFGLFDEAHGSDGFTNLSGKAKYDAIAQRHAGQFTYIGDSRSDLEIWSRCRSAVLAGRGEHLRSRLNEDVEVVAEFPCAEAKLATWRRALRLHQWAKNALIFIPLLLSGMFTDARSVLLAFTAFIAFGLLASATYLVNDLFDLPNDRRHRVKRNRPLASGELPLQRGVAAIPLLLLAASAVMSLLPHKFAGVAVLYAVVTLAYSIIFKRQPILDVLVLAGLFTFRLLA